MSARPYHELAATVGRLEAELTAFAPLAQMLIKLEQRAEAAEERARNFERGARELERRLAASAARVDELEAREGTPAEREAYRRGYHAGHHAGVKGRASDPERSLQHKHNRLRLA